MTNDESITVTVVLGLGLTFSPASPAAGTDSAREACAALVNARSALWSMIDAKDKSEQDALKAKMQGASTKLDSALTAMTGGDAKVAADFKAVWDEFKATRDNEIVPAIHKGNARDAKTIANGIQAERLAKMWVIMSCKAR